MNWHRFSRLFVAWCGAVVIPPMNCAMAKLSPPATQPKAAINVATTVEDHKKLLVATVKADGKPVEDALVVFSARRTFGDLLLGQEKTLDDGSAAVPFPSDLPGASTGTLHFIVEIKSPEALAGTRVEQDLDGGRVVAAVDASLPRALWAPNAPLVLLVSVGALLLVIWGTYGYVIWKIFRIRKGATQWD